MRPEPCFFVCRTLIVAYLHYCDTSLVRNTTTRMLWLCRKVFGSSMSSNSTGSEFGLAFSLAVFRIDSRIPMTRGISPSESSTDRIWNCSTMVESSLGDLAFSRICRNLKH